MHPGLIQDMRAEATPSPGSLCQAPSSIRGSTNFTASVLLEDSVSLASDMRSCVDGDGGVTSDSRHQRWSTGAMPMGLRAGGGGGGGGGRSSLAIVSGHAMTAALYACCFALELSFDPSSPLTGIGTNFGPSKNGMACLCLAFVGVLSYTTKMSGAIIWYTIPWVSDPAPLPERTPLQSLRGSGPRGCGCPHVFSGSKHVFIHGIPLSNTPHHHLSGAEHGTAPTWAPWNRRGTVGGQWGARKKVWLGGRGVPLSPQTLGGNLEKGQSPFKRAV